MSYNTFRSLFLIEITHVIRENFCLACKLNIIILFYKEYLLINIDYCTIMARF